ncbi:MAG: valine--tRNA ligase [Spirochaetia bacterium]
MKAVELAKVYDPKDFEDRLYDYWMENNLFAPKEDAEGEHFSIVIPPPNVTGVLHMGHGLNNSLQDVLVRYHRMRGVPTLWVPGTDHAGIATQNVVEKRLRKNGISRHDIGREKFVQETWKVKEEHHKVIVRQLQKIGASCDWSRERFTLDEGLSKAVNEVFVGLFEKGLIYKGKYLVNWCPSCGTALSDDEVEHKEQNGKLYHYHYPMVDGSGKISVATTRPETMLGDTAVAVHPEDDRYKGLIGKEVHLPLTDRTIPIIADAYVDMEFGSGAVKITPAHDQNDFEIGNRHNLEKLNILNDDATLNQNVPTRYQNMHALQARKLVIQDLKDQGFFEKEEDIVHQIGHCYRCDTRIEPYLSEQWFVRMKPLAQKALKLWEDDKIRFFPKKWENTYKHWLGNIRDWCISRQLWWGHRIPVWYCQNCDDYIVSREAPANCKSCGGSELKQDEDVLDTWFSSWLWPFSTLGWPEETLDLKKYFPTTALVTAYDIIFFWVSRMIMASAEFMGEAPFRDIYIHQLVRDLDGRKMSKSLGNGIDPLDVVDEYGADSLKFTLAFMAAQGQDILLDKESFKLGSKFANKIWNASRYLLMNIEGKELLSLDQIVLTDLDKWIYHRLNQAAALVKKAMKEYKFNDAAHAVYEYFWNDFCDWYIEASKITLYSKEKAEQNRTVSMLMHILEESLRLLHPFLSFISEEIYQKLPNTTGSIVVSKYPQFEEARSDYELNTKYEYLQTIITSIRTVRSEFAISPDKKAGLDIYLECDEKTKAFIANHTKLIAQLTSSVNITILENKLEEGGTVPAIGNGFEAYIHLKDAIDIPKEIERLKKHIMKNEDFREKTQKKLGNPKFLENAPKEVVEKEKSKLQEANELIAKMEKHVKALSS